jgi:hypothetical protein
MTMQAQEDCNSNTSYCCSDQTKYFFVAEAHGTNLNEIIDPQNNEGMRCRITIIIIWILSFNGFEFL